VQPLPSDAPLGRDTFFGRAMHFNPKIEWLGIGKIAGRYFYLRKLVDRFDRRDACC
jgi:hypothetical protein